VSLFTLTLSLRLNEQDKVGGECSMTEKRNAHAILVKDIKEGEYFYHLGLFGG
jgi:hypothetical protein